MNDVTEKDILVTLDSLTSLVDTEQISKEFRYFYEMQKQLESDMKARDFKNTYIGSKSFKKNRRNKKRRK